MQRTAGKYSLQSDRHTTSQYWAIHWRNLISPTINFQHKNGPQSPFSGSPAHQFLPPPGKPTLIAEHLCYTPSDIFSFVSVVQAEANSETDSKFLAPGKDPHLQAGFYSSTTTTDTWVSAYISIFLCWSHSPQKQISKDVLFPVLHWDTWSSLCPLLQTKLEQTKPNLINLSLLAREKEWRGRRYFSHAFSF